MLIALPSLQNSKVLINWNDIQLGPKIGEGGFGNVFKGMWQVRARVPSCLCRLY